MLRLAIEGNIAAGKSTFVSLLDKINRPYVCVPEPVSKWQTVEVAGEEEGEGHNVLHRFYEDPKRWAYTFQSYAFISRMRAQLQPDDFFASNESDGKAPPEMVVFERSVLSDKRCFAENCFESGKATSTHPSTRPTPTSMRM